MKLISASSYHNTGRTYFIPLPIPTTTFIKQFFYTTVKKVNHLALSLKRIENTCKFRWEVKKFLRKAYYLLRDFFEDELISVKLINKM